MDEEFQAEEAYMRSSLGQLKNHEEASVARTWWHRDHSEMRFKRGLINLKKEFGFYST